MALPTKQDFLANLPLVSAQEGEDCFICFDPYERTQLFPNAGDPSEEVTHRAVETPCAHVVGETCLLEWLAKRNSCPLCRQALCGAEDAGFKENDEDEDSEEAADDADIELVQEMLDLNLDLSLNDLENVSELAHHFARRRTYQRRREPAAVLISDRSIDALCRARVACWKHDDLELEERNFRNDMFGAVPRQTVPAPSEAEERTVDAEAIARRLSWYFDRTLENACADYEQRRRQIWRAPDYPRGTLGMVLHPEAMVMVERAIEVVRGMEGKPMSAGKMRREIWESFLEGLDEGGGPWGLCTVVKDLAEVAALGLCGMPVRLTVTGPGREEREVVFPAEVWQLEEEK